MNEILVSFIIILLITLATIINNTSYQLILLITAFIIAFLTIIKSIIDDFRKPQYI